MRVLLLIAPLVAVLTLPCAALAQTRSGAEQLKAADRSFSDVPFGATLPQPTLTIMGDDICLEWGECVYGNVEGVEHYFWDGELVVKSVEAAAQPISALGIGDARAMGEVLVRVRRFLPEAAIDCRADKSAMICSAGLGDGWITLSFDSNHRLTEARIDAYHFT